MPQYFWWQTDQGHLNEDLTSLLLHHGCALAMQTSPTTVPPLTDLKVSILLLRRKTLYDTEAVVHLQKVTLQT